MKVILFGYYGFRNVGDEQLLDESIRLFNEYVPNINFIVASGPRPLPFDTFNRWNLFTWIYQLITSKYIIFSGGSVFQTLSSTMSLIYYLLIVLFAKVFGCKIILLCHGWGPFKYKWHERLATYILSKSFVKRSWRDQLSCDSFGNIDDQVFCDLVLLQPRQGALIGSSSMTSVIGISLKHPDIRQNVVRVCDQNNKKVTLLINQPTRAIEKNEMFLEDIWDTPKDFISDLIITDRYHTAVWAAKFGVPWIAVSMDPKLKALAITSHQSIIDPSSLHWMDDLTNLIKERSESVPNGSLIHWYDSFQLYREPVGKWLYEQLSV